MKIIYLWNRPIKYPTPNQTFLTENWKYSIFHHIKKLKITTSVQLRFQWQAPVMATVPPLESHPGIAEVAQLSRYLEPVNSTQSL